MPRAGRAALGAPAAPHRLLRRTLFWRRADACRRASCPSLPCLRTESQLMEGDYVAVEVVLDERRARDMIPFVKRLGATGVFTYPIQVILH